MAQEETTSWQRVRVEPWYGQSRGVIEVASQTAVWCHAGKPVVPIRWVLIRDPQGTFDTEALLSTDLTWSALEIVLDFVQRWTLEVTLEEVRAHLGVETQRQWNDRAIARTTPALLALFSIVTLMARGLGAPESIIIRRTAWYRKGHATFSDTIAWVRRYLWATVDFSMSSETADIVNIPRSLVERFIDAVCHAA